MTDIEQRFWTAYGKVPSDMTEAEIAEARADLASLLRSAQAPSLDRKEEP